MTPLCPRCGLQFGEGWDALRERLAPEIAGFGLCAVLVDEFIKRADSSRVRGIREFKARAVLADLRALYDDDRFALYHALECTIDSDGYNYARQNLLGYIRAVHRSAKKRLPEGSEAALLKLAWEAAGNVFRARRRILELMDDWAAFTEDTFPDWTHKRLSYRTAKLLVGWKDWLLGNIDDDELRRRIVARAVELVRKGGHL